MPDREATPTGNRIITAMRGAGIADLKELGRRADLSDVAISRCIFEPDPSDYRLGKIAEALSVDLESLRAVVTHPRTPRQAHQPAWEYRVIDTGVTQNNTVSRVEAMLNELGADGWELVRSTRPSPSGLSGDSVQYIFKRPA